jgi:GTP cyclohydrolase I
MKNLIDENEIGEESEDIKLLSHHIKEMLKILGEDPDREGLRNTPLRVAKVFKYLTSGSIAEKEIETMITKGEFTHHYNEMVVMKDIEFYSLCEHHMLPFYGVVHVAYVPKGKVIGLSKIPRLVEIYAKRLQIQEQLTVQIRDALQHYLHPQGVAVAIQAHHMCMMVRGVQKIQSVTITSALSGIFLEDHKTREEFMGLVGLSKL